jgi:tetratricopeptide (TPR) repeat protein
MPRPILVLLSIIFVCCTCTGQQSIGPTNRQITDFAFGLSIQPADKRAEMLTAHSELITVALRRELISLGNVRFTNTEYAKALDIYQLAQKISEQIGDKEGIATARLNSGSVYYFQGNYDLALDNYRKGETLFLSLNNRFEAARCHYGIGLAYQAQRKETDALKTFEEALPEFQSAGDKTELLNTLASIGGLQYQLGNYEAASKTLLAVAALGENGEIFSRVAEAFYMQHDYAQALVYYQRALELFTAQNSIGGTITALGGSGNCYFYQRNYDRALELYNRTLALEQKLNDQTGVATRLQNIGHVHRARGDYASALAAYFKSLSIAEQLPGKATAATTLGSIGLVRAMQGDNAQAVDYFNRSLNAYQISGDEVGMSRMLSYIGNARYTQGQYDQALDAYEKALELHKKRSDDLNTAHGLLGIGSVYRAQRKFPLALQSFHDGLALYTTLGRKADMADALSRLAATYREQGDATRALEFAQNAARTAKDAGALSIVVYALTEAGKAQRDLGRKNEALNAFTEAMQVQRSIRPETGPDGLEAERGGVLPFLGAMETLIDLNRPIDALVRAEEAKSQTLRELIQRGDFTVTKGMTAVQREEELKLLGELISLKVQVYGAQDSANPKQPNSALRNRLQSARAAYEVFRKRLYTLQPQLAVNRGELSTLNAAGLRSLISSNTALIEYAVTEQQVILFVVTANGKQLEVKAYPLGVTPAEITQKIAAFRQSVGEHFAARELYGWLLQPAENQLGKRTKLIIVPDGPLWDVPFEALKSAKDQYVIDWASVSYVPSLSALREMRRRRATRIPNPTLLVFADPTLTKEVVARVQTTYNGLRISETAAKPTGSDTFQSKFGLTRVRSYSDVRATRQRLKAEANVAGALEFAVPVILDNAVPMYSFFALSPDPDIRDDGVLRLSEITNLNSGARIVILPHVFSANSQSGNALIAFSWSWFVAGTPAVLLSRWQTNDGSDSANDLFKKKQWAGYMFLGTQ